MSAHTAPRIVLNVRPGCHLCGPAREVVRQVAQETGAGWREVDIEEGPDAPALEAAFGDKVPAVTVDGALVAYWRVDADVLRRALRR
ncbi:glutaredoxin family protein [Isoptericola sp. b441]|uniref:Glutaredoxin family protein n=1 Tax=Actinotalea lenta TaxID=3064654 RepID=A0ABT9D6M5_9CELL|nr:MULTISPECIES: glutaredoxin family protein [unclassified Isoptericola]MDO8106487.1 glutaredoxin family protein [Isoptericola sp. b441]MDO8121797.1 glutaredoxin family protein [Isoptericola sp. b490]